MKTHDRDQMEKPQIICKYCNRNYWFVFFLLLLFCYYSSLFVGNKGLSLYTNSTCYNFLDSTPHSPIQNSSETKENTTESIPKQKISPNFDSCSGRYIYVHDLPIRFNQDILKNCSLLNKWLDMCKPLLNHGLGPQAANSQGVLQNNTSWFVTSQFMLELIFHNRMRRYKCLTNDSSLASAIYVPFYAGLDVGRYLWDFNASMRDSNPLGLVKWLSEKPEWIPMAGKDHFFVAGRVTWDFRRLSDNESDWGNKLLMLPEAKNMTMLGIESSPWSSQDFAIPYPTYFHPRTDSEVFWWQDRLRRQRRRYLFSFVGAPRPTLQDSIRGKIIKQCLSSKKKCRLLDCNSGNCHSPVRVMKMFQRSTFCLQPPGDSYTRRSTFDSILAGCIPVFFHPGSAYVQYIWHLPKNYTKYSVLIPENDIRDGKASIEKTLLKISKQQVLGMRKEVIRLIPRIIYANPMSSLVNIEDAFDIAVKGVLERVGKIRREMKEGRNSNTTEFEEKNSWKYYLFGTEKKHEWDYFFSEKR